MTRLYRATQVLAAPGLAPAVPTQKPNIEDYLERVAKLVPVELIAAFLAIRAVTPAGALPVAVELAVYAALVILTPAYLIKFGGAVEHKSRQALIATLSFVLWSYAIGGFFWPALEHAVHHVVVYQGLAGVLVVLWTLIAALLVPKMS